MKRVIGSVVSVRCRLMIVALISAGYVGCESTDSPTSSPDRFGDLSDASPQDQYIAASMADDARKELEHVLTERVYDADQIDLAQMNFGEADRLYKQAIAADPKNTEAQFGAAVSHLLNLSTNGDIRAVQDSMDSFMEDEDSPNSANKVARLPLIPAKMTMRALQDPLTVSDLQKTITDEIIPAIDYALNRLSIVEGDPDFTFILTAKMMGDEDEDPLEIDLGEVYLLNAQLRFLKGILLVMVAYDFDFDYQGNYEWLREYPSDDNILRHLERLDKTGTFLTLKSADSMRNAKGEILEAIAKMERAIESIRAETDDQDDDVIREEDIEDLDSEVDLSEEGEDTPAFFRDMRTTDDVLRKARETLEGTVEIEADFDDDEDTPKSIIVFDLGQFFDAPIRDLRTLLPYHTWHLDLLHNRNFADELVLTDAAGVALGSSPAVVFPDPSFGGILSNISTTPQLLDLFGIDASENLNELDLLYELGIVGDYDRDGGIIVTNNSSDPVEVFYSAEIGDDWVEDHSVIVAAGTQGLDVVRSEFNLPLNGDSWDATNFTVSQEGTIIFRHRFWPFGNIFVTVDSVQITLETANYERHYDDPTNPYTTTYYVVASKKNPDLLVGAWVDRMGFALTLRSDGTFVDYDEDEGTWSLVGDQLIFTYHDAEYADYGWTFTLISVTDNEFTVNYDDSRFVFTRQ